jgi:2-methylcitrate synthase
MAEAATKAGAGGGLRNVVAGQSALSTIDGAKGILSYRGIDIHALAEHSGFEEAVFLLHRGALPTRAQLDAFRRDLARERALPDAALSVLHALPRSAHPMTALRSVVSALGALDPDAADDGEAARERKALRLVAQMATVVAAIERVRNGWAPVSPDQTLPHGANLLYMLRGQRPSDSEARIMDVALVLHADHEFNASTFVARVTASTLADIHGAVTAAIAALKGPLHGGANEAVMQTLSEIKTTDRVEPYLKDAFANKRKVMGFGHAVYKTEDPRATHLRQLSRKLGEEKGDRRWFDLSEKIEEFVKREKGLYANVDFYSASLYHVLGLPTDLFTPVFAVSRVAGWTAHALEQIANNKLIRPESEYIGLSNVPYVPIEARG